MFITFDEWIDTFHVRLLKIEKYKSNYMDEKHLICNKNHTYSKDSYKSYQYQNIFVRI